MQLERAAAVKRFRIVSLFGVGISSVAGFLYSKRPYRDPRAVDSPGLHYGLSALSIFNLLARGLY